MCTLVTHLRPVHRRYRPVVHGHDDIALPGAAPEGRAVRPHALDDQVKAPLLAKITNVVAYTGNFLFRNKIYSTRTDGLCTN